jgi:hypothetical protein
MSQERRKRLSWPILVLIDGFLVSVPSALASKLAERALGIHDSLYSILILSVLIVGLPSLLLWRYLYVKIFREPYPPKRAKRGTQKGGQVIL